MPANTCDSCGQEIFLVEFGLHYKWVTNPTRAKRWKCGNDPRFPVKAHHPKVNAEGLYV